MKITGDGDKVIKKWEYDRCNVLHGDVDYTLAINGEDGWELVYYRQHYDITEMIFKREKT